MVTDDFFIYVFVFFGFALVISTFQAALFATKDSNAPRVYAPSWMQRPMEAVRYMPSVAQPTVPPQAVTQLQLPQGWVKSRHIIHGRYVYKAYTLAHEKHMPVVVVNIYALHGWSGTWWTMWRGFAASSMSLGG